MTPILLNQLRSLISSSLISKFSKRFEENEILLRKSIDTSICTVLIGLNSIIDNSVLYNKIIESITSSEFYKSASFENETFLFKNNSFEEGFAFLSLIFPTKKNRISEMISNEVGIKSETAYVILNFVVMVILSHFKNENQKTKIIQNTLNREKKAIICTLPEGIRVILGYSNFECEEGIYVTPNQFTKSDTSISFLKKIFKL